MIFPLREVGPLQKTQPRNARCLKHRVQMEIYFDVHECIYVMATYMHMA